MDIEMHIDSIEWCATAMHHQLLVHVSGFDEFKNDFRIRRRPRFNLRPFEEGFDLETCSVCPTSEVHSGLEFVPAIVFGLDPQTSDLDVTTFTISKVRPQISEMIEATRLKLRALYLQDQVLASTRTAANPNEFGRQLEALGLHDGTGVGHLCKLAGLRIWTSIEYVALDFICQWEAEHGISIFFHGTTLVGIGDWGTQPGEF